MDASGIHAKRFNMKEVILLKSGEDFIFPVADGTVTPFGGDQALKIHTLIRNQLIRGESHHDFLGESEGSPPAQRFKTHIRMPVKHEMISGPSQVTSFTAITLNYESNSTRREKNHFLIN